MNAATLFGAGIPTEPDVDRLFEKLGTPAVAAIVRYDDIATVIGVARDSSRFGSVVSAWKKRLYTKHNLIVKAVPNVGFEVLNNSQRVNFSATRYKHNLRGIRRAADVACRTDSVGLAPEELRARDHIVRVGATLQLAAATAARELRK